MPAIDLSAGSVTTKTLHCSHITVVHHDAALIAAKT